ncbi:MIP family Ig-specific serine endopeptidase [Mycoplasmopsis glycophila]|uniref:Domain of uncharacterized function DUF31 n=1 Tax=Mycoplasmopsis glycophila TaxID=171285 RepID=A0A449AUN9_9BACT|nr:hypothetical protein [Mycoplasmopsis glycophila]VEU70208.1 Domain of uncharacterised function DUF31 [Mycoplasmopsis glycophila]
MKFFKSSKKIASLILLSSPLPFLLSSCYSKIQDANFSENSGSQNIQKAQENKIQEIKEQIVGIRSKINTDIENYNSIYANWSEKIDFYNKIGGDISNVESEVRLFQSQYQVLNDKLNEKIANYQKDTLWKNNAPAQDALAKLKVKIDLSDLDYQKVQNTQLIALLQAMNEENLKTKQAQQNIFNKEQELAQLKTKYFQNQDVIRNDYDTLQKILTNTIANIDEIRQKENALKTLSKVHLVKDTSSEVILLKLSQLEPLPKLPSDIAPSTPIENPDLPNIDNNPSQPNPGDESEDNSNVPSLPWNFPIQDFSKENSYPDSSFMSRFEKLKNSLTSEMIYGEIYDRTFTFKYSIQNKENQNVPFEPAQGTAWIIDYHKYTNAANKYKIFMATNMHVLEFFSNAHSNPKLLNYQDPTQNQVVDFALGKTINRPNFNDIPNKSWKNHIQDKGGNVNYQYGKQNGISSPQIVFAAVDFMNDPNAYNGLDLAAYKAKFLESIEYIKNENGEAQYQAAVRYAQSLNKIPFYSDFAIFEFDIDLNSAQTSGTLKTWVKNAIDALDRYNLRKGEVSPNRLVSDIPFHIADYVSKGQNQLTKAYSDYNNISLANAKNLYVAGYPASRHDLVYWMQNNPTERNSDIISYFKSPKNKDAFAFSTNNFDSKIQSGNPAVKRFWNRPFLDFYGLIYNIRFSSLYYGASGSVVYNDFGQVVGIYSGVSQRAEYGDLLQAASYTPLIQATDIKLANGKIAYAYNLIDGADKTKYPKQTSSYRENLRKIYPNGFEDGSKTTTIFEQGY